MKKHEVDKWAGFDLNAKAKAQRELGEHEVFEKDGKRFIRYPWGQELPALESEAELWDRLQDVKSGLSAEAIKEYFEETKMTPDDVPEELTFFVAWVLGRAEKLRKARAALAQEEPAVEPT
jgi:hypothetical protein